MQEKEVWKCLEGYPAHWVSNLGRVCREIIGQEGSGSILKACPRGAKNPYLAVSLRRLDGQRQTLYVHRLVAEAFLGPCPEGMEVDHKDGDKANNAETNLAYLPHMENLRKARGLPPAVRVRLGASPETGDPTATKTATTTATKPKNDIPKSLEAYF